MPKYVLNMDPAWQHFCCKKPSQLLSEAVLLRDQECMTLCFDKLAESQDEHLEVPIAACVWHPEHGVCALECNQPIRLHDASAHAEMRALRTACQRVNNYRLVGCTLYVTLEPCAMCFYACMQARVERIVFGCADSKLGLLSQGRYQEHHCFGNHHFSWTAGVQAASGRYVLAQFFQKKRR